MVNQIVESNQIACNLQSDNLVIAAVLTLALNMTEIHDLGGAISKWTWVYFSERSIKVETKTRNIRPTISRQLTFCNLSLTFLKQNQQMKCFNIDKMEQEYVYLVLKVHDTS